MLTSGLLTSMNVWHSMLLALMAANTSAKIVETLYGQVDGNTVTLDDGKVVNSWYGIPYARPPIGELRFAVSICSVELLFYWLTL
jgi:hypothetical protein